MNCDVIKDLLPLYVDECCSAESTRLIGAHLSQCSECRMAHEQMSASCASPKSVAVKLRPRRVSDWEASVLQSLMLFISFAVMTLGVVLEGGTPEGGANGLWAVALIVPATGYLLSLAHWFFLRLYKNRKLFCISSCLVTVAITALGYVWVFLHYGKGIDLNSYLVWLGAALCVLFCILSGALSNIYALLLGRE